MLSVARSRCNNAIHSHNHTLTCSFSCLCSRNSISIQERKPSRKRQAAERAPKVCGAPATPPPASPQPAAPVHPHLCTNTHPTPSSTTQHPGSCCADRSQPDWPLVWRGRSSPKPPARCWGGGGEWGGHLGKEGWRAGSELPGASAPGWGGGRGSNWPGEVPEFASWRSKVGESSPLQPEFDEGEGCHI